MLHTEPHSRPALSALGAARAEQWFVDSEFYDLTKLAAQVCDVPLAGLLLVDHGEIVSRLNVGVDLREDLTAFSFAGSALAQAEPMILPDIADYPRFAANHLVTGEPGLRFYAGIRLRPMNDGPCALLYIADLVTKQLTQAQRRGFLVLANQVKTSMALKLRQEELNEALTSKDTLLRELRASETRFRAFMNNCPFLTFIKDEAGRFVFYNHRVAEHFGISADEWIGRTDTEIWSADLAGQFDEHDQEVHDSGRLQESLEETRDADGQVTSWHSYKFPWITGSGERWLGAFVVDVTEENQRRIQLEEANQKLEKLATIDPLTGLGNRRVLDERIELEYRFAVRHKIPLSVVMLDLDHFKQRNDLFGHESGDEVLRRLGRLIARTLRTTDMAARYGGEEFVILLPKADLAGAGLFLERLLEAMRVEPWPDRTVTASIGVAALDESTTSGKKLILQADAAMYEAKRAGRNRIVTFPQVQEGCVQDAKHGRPAGQD